MRNSSRETAFCSSDYLWSPTSILKFGQEGSHDGNGPGNLILLGMFSGSAL